MINKTIDTANVQLFNQYASAWWDENGPFKPLHQLNPIRLRYIKNHCVAHFKCQTEVLPLTGLRVIDVGCGGGLLCEPLARLGATVTGIDASENAITCAQDHATQQNLDISYHCTPIENFTDGTFDVVFALEIVEHVMDIPAFIKECSRLLNKGGLLFISTLNRTWKSYLSAIIGAEYLLRWIPVGTHSWDQFLKPSELSQYLNDNSLEFIDLKGISYAPLRRAWKLTDSLSVNYIGCVVKT